MTNISITVLGTQQFVYTISYQLKSQQINSEWDKYYKIFIALKATIVPLVEHEANLILTPRRPFH